MRFSFKKLGVALLIDALDLIPLVWLPIANEITDTIQTVLAVVYFKDLFYALDLVEVGIPAPIDPLVPTTTILYLLRTFTFVKRR